MIIYVDIDNTILKTEGTDYSKCEPMLDRIEAINNLYDQGHEIVYWTARGTSTKEYEKKLTLTKKQLADWGVKYTTLKVGKPAYDVWIDDKAWNVNNYFGDR